MAVKNLKFLFLADNFQTNWPTDLILGMKVGHHNIQVRLSTKVTGQGL